MYIYPATPLSLHVRTYMHVLVGVVISCPGYSDVGVAKRIVVLVTTDRYSFNIGGRSTTT